MGLIMKQTIHTRAAFCVLSQCETETDHFSGHQVNCILQCILFSLILSDLPLSPHWSPFVCPRVFFIRVISPNEFTAACWEWINNVPVLSPFFSNWPSGENVITFIKTVEERDRGRLKLCNNVNINSLSPRADREQPSPHAGIKGCLAENWTSTTLTKVSELVLNFNFLSLDGFALVI